MRAALSVSFVTCIEIRPTAVLDYQGSKLALKLASSQAGFTAGQASCNAGSCEGGIDVPACELQLEYQCGSDVSYAMLLDTCAGHAQPYHLHMDPVCDYVRCPEHGPVLHVAGISHIVAQNPSSAGHSTIVGIALDGYGIYGRYESTGTIPSDLDACGGHTGPIPGDTSLQSSASTVYHYHTQTRAPCR